MMAGVDNGGPMIPGLTELGGKPPLPAVPGQDPPDIQTFLNRYCTVYCGGPYCTSLPQQ